LEPLNNPSDAYLKDRVKRFRSLRIADKGKGKRFPSPTKFKRKNEMLKTIAIASNDIDEIADDAKATGRLMF